MSAYIRDINNERLGAPSRNIHVDVVNGVKAVTLGALDTTTAEHRAAGGWHMSADEAIELAVALLNAAGNLNLGLHAKEVSESVWTDRDRAMQVLGPDIPYEEPAPEENFWDDRTTPLAYSESDSIRDMEARREIAEKLDSDFAAGKLSIMNGWLVGDAGEHTCGGYGEASGYMHEPGCGWEPLTDLASQMVPEMVGQ